MAYVVIVTERAASDLKESVEWWSRERSREQAARWYAGIRQAIDSLANQPERFSLSAENGEFSIELREILFGLGTRPTHRIVFTIVRQTVVVLTIRHAAQNRIQPDDFLS
jgi:plasmid stabilization system protein ParE